MGVANDHEGQARVGAFTKGLQELGWIDGRTVQIEYRWAAGAFESTQVYARELVHLAPEVILATASPVVAALKQETKTLPIIFVNVSDPVGQRFVESLAHPGGNVTGFTNFEFSMVSKWLEMLKEIAPTVRNVALLYNPQTASSFIQHYWEPFESVAPQFGFHPQAAPVGQVGE